ncbi:MAG: hypothetical protein H6Q74_1369 [Firmicutes bacterium]|nr:hypothetical protein [Bacillota bacterium]
MVSLDKTILNRIMQVLFVIGCYILVSYSNATAFLFAVISGVLLYNQYLTNNNQAQKGNIFVIIMGIAFIGILGIIKILLLVIK